MQHCVKMKITKQFTVLSAICIVGISCERVGTEPTCPSTGRTFYPNYGNCKAFYECNDGDLYQYTCPGGAAWDMTKNSCRDEKDVDCSYVTAPNDNDECPSTGLSYLPNYSDCTKYYKCENGLKTSVSCPAGEAWNIHTVACDLIDHVDCSYTTLYPPTTARPNNGCPYPSNVITYLPDEYDCSYFYECDKGRKTRFVCPDRYLWDITVNECRDRSTVDCSYTSTYSTASPIPTWTNPTVTTSRPLTTPTDEICHHRPEGTKFADPTDCTKYLECDQGKLIERDCAAGTSYNQNTGDCDENWDQNCGTLILKRMFS